MSEDNIEMADGEQEKPAAPEVPEQKPNSIVKLSVGDRFEIRGIKYIIAAINKDCWLIMKPYVDEKIQKPGISGMMQRLNGITLIHKKK